MFVGILQFELVIPGAESLKDKRRVVRSVKDRLHREHLVSIAEIGALDHHRLALMGLAVVSNSAGHVSTVLDRVIAKLRALHEAELGHLQRDVLQGDQLPAGPDEAPLWTEDERRQAPGAMERSRP